LGKTFNRHLIAVLPNLSLGPSVLAVHIRSGDIFRRSLRHYSTVGQPPCNFYVDVVRLRNYSSGEVFTQDAENPCVAPVLATPNTTWNRRPLADELALMLSARKFVMAKSSFSKSIVYLSLVDKVSYACDYARPDLWAHYESVPTAEYYNLVFVGWRSFLNARALAAMRTASCAYWAWYDGVESHPLLEL
jgi:hypothetical protein